MDFDAHDGDFMRARDLALKAFGVFYRQPQVFVCLTTSAGDPERSGFHLFVFSRELYPCEDWTRLLKQVCAQIGAEIRPGIVEIFPDEFRGIGKALRALGSFNPKTGDCGLILHENLTYSFLPAFPAEEKEMPLLFLYSANHDGRKRRVHRVAGFSGVNEVSGKLISPSPPPARGTKN